MNILKMATKIIPLLLILSITVNGISFDKEINVGEITNGDRQVSPSIVIDDQGVIYLFWNEIGNTKWQIVYRKYDGNVWSQPYIVETPSRHDTKPQVAYGNGKIHLVWVYYDINGDTDIYYMNFDGNKWSEPLEISSDLENETQMSPKISVNGDTIHIIWNELIEGWNEIFYRNYNGEKWENETMISSLGGGNKKDPNIYSSPNEVQIVWTDYQDGDGDIFYRVNENGTWSDEIELSSDNYQETQYEPRIVQNKRNITYCVWSGNDLGNYDIYLRMKDTTGWGYEFIVNPNRDGDQLEPYIEVTDDDIFITWTDYSGDSDIFFRYFQNGKWYSSQEISTDISNQNQRNSVLFVKNFNLYFSWSDDLNGEFEIIFRSADNYPKPSIENIRTEGKILNEHVTDHTPIITWTYIDEFFPDQVAYNVSVWKGQRFLSNLFGFINKTGSESSWEYYGDLLLDGQSYNISIQVYNGYKWSEWLETTFSLNSKPSTPTNPNYNQSTVDIGPSNSTRLSWDPCFDADGDSIIYTVYGGFDNYPPESSWTTITNETTIKNIEDDGKYFWKVCAFDGYEWSNSSIWSFNIDKNDAPFLINGNVEPKEGDINSFFNFSIAFYDEDSDFPINITLNINNEKFELAELDLQDSNTEDGKIYYKNFKIPHGIYEYFFTCYDEHDTYSISEVFSGPNVTYPETGLDSITLIAIPNVIYLNDIILFHLDYDSLNSNNFSVTWNFSDGNNLFEDKEILYEFKNLGNINISVKLTDIYGKYRYINTSVEVKEKSKTEEELNLQSVLLIIIPIILVIMIIISIIWILIHRSSVKTIIPTR